MALDACSGSGSLKLGEAPYMRPCFTLALCCYQLQHTLIALITQLLEQHGTTLGSFRNIVENQTPVFKAVLKWNTLSAHFAPRSGGLDLQSDRHFCVPYTNIYFSSLSGTLKATNGCVRCLFIKTFASDGFALDGPPNTLDVQLMSLDDAVMHTHYTVTSKDKGNFYQIHCFNQL